MAVSEIVSISVGIIGLLVLVIFGFRLRNSLKRLNRSIDPIAQNSKTLKLEVSALRRSRLDRQRRLEGKEKSNSSSKE